MREDRFNVAHDAESSCPSCGHRFDKHAGEDEPPSAGDVTVCFKCMATLVFKENGTLRKAKPGELTDSEMENVESARDLIRSGWVPPGGG